MRIASHFSAALVACFFLFLCGDISLRGLPEIDLAYWVSSPSDSGRSGGIAPVLLSTAAILLVALLVAIPMAASSAILCSEMLGPASRIGRYLRRSNDIMVSAPSVAVGLVGWSFFSKTLGLGFSLLSGGLTLALMLVPLMASVFLTALEGVPAELRAQALALGMSRWQVLWQLAIPHARPMLLAGVVLAIGKSLGETAALVLTSGISMRLPTSFLDSGASLAVHVYQLARNVPGGESRAYAAAVALLGVNLIVHLVLVRLRAESRS